MVPYRDLYVYEISGKVTGSRNFFTVDFIGCWTEGEGSFLFFSSPHDDEIGDFVQQRGLRLVAKEVLDYKAWQAGEELKPFRVGNLLIRPPWERGRVKRGERLIHLDPCVVFGTGYHPTTRCCLEALWEIYQKESPSTVLDLGTGSGILALAAAKWGAEKIQAIDCNELAVDTALRNVALNQESGRIEVRQGRAEKWVEEEADLVCANLHRQVIETLVERPALYRKRWIILSGIFVGDDEEVERKLNRNGVQTFRRIHREKWATIVGVKG